jgi:dihydrofolate reductase
MIKAIMAVDDKWGIGKNGSLPWPKNSEDLKYFSKQTTGHIVVMGRKTWEDPCFPRPLPNRENIVITSKQMDEVETISGSIMRDLQKLDFNSEKDVWLIGGRQVIESYIDLVDEFHLTSIPGDYECDTFLDEEILDGFVLDKVTKSVTSDNTYTVYVRGL